MSSESSPPRPPSPPAVARALQLPPHQIVSVALFALVTVLALAGVFGHASALEEARGAALSLRVEHPARLRYRQSAELRAWITNTSSRRLDSVRVSFDSAWVNGFSSVQFTPSVDEAFVVVLTGIEAGETRLVHAQLDADDAGLRRGTVSASADGRDSVRTSLRTLVFP